MKTINYRPHKNGFPYKLLKYLYANGKSSGIDIQEAIGLNKWADEKGIIFFSRASVNFDTIISQLEKRGLINILENDTYELTRHGKIFIEKYTVR
jgi:hypothetical protein